VKRLIIALCTVVAVGALAAPAFGAVNFRSQPTCQDVGTQVQCTGGRISGLGNEAFFIEISATGIASVECTNPGGNVAPGQDTEVTTAGSFGPFTADRNGNFRFPTLTTGAPPNPSGAEACPNPQWTAEITDVTFDTPATISIIQGGEVVATTEVDIAP
jgi:hypothetical protein